MTGAVSYHAGYVAEAAVANHYIRNGAAVAARRWRGTGGEIDLILRQGSCLIFVEVKKSRSHARAAERVSRRQLERIYASAAEFVAGEPRGQDTDMRFDVAMLDSIGQIKILENAFLT